MASKATSVEDYLAQIPEERKEVFNLLRDTIIKNLKGYEEVINYGMIGYVVPLTSYPDGYHCNPKLQLPFINLASQKNFIALYHMGMYAQPEIQEWFVTEYPKHCKYKLDMGKSCVRFKKMDDIPFKLVAQLIKKMSIKDWIKVYEKNIKK